MSRSALLAAVRLACRGVAAGQSSSSSGVWRAAGPAAGGAWAPAWRGLAAQRPIGLGCWDGLSRGFAAGGARCRAGGAAAAAARARPLALARGFAAGGGGAGAGAAAGAGGGAAAGGGGAGRKSPITFNSMLVGIGCFLAVVAAAQNKAQQKVEGMMQRSQEVVGKAAVGGPFALIDQDGRPFTHEDLRGAFSVLYFGFTHCPDICPDELEKLAAALDRIEAATGGYQVRPVFISVDPARDSPRAVKAYVREFHPRLVGLTGSEEAVRATSKAFRVYFHKTGESEADYLVDHSIIMYLLDPAGEFVTFYGKNFTAEQLADSISAHITRWQAANGGAGGGGAAAGGGGGGDAGSRVKTGTAGSQEGLPQK
ncbi:HCC1 [Scenedesmus sp. PABB004]|nr:HCC1 [Scenedesmus sp. PABB004]